MKTLAKFSTEEYHQIIESGILCDRSVELLNGEIWEMPPEKPLHRKVIYFGVEYLRQMLSGKAIVFEAHPITLKNSEPEPDITVVQLPISLYDERHPSALDILLLIEVSDTTLSKDLQEKKVIYALNKIREYWVIDLNNHQLKVFQNPVNDNYIITKILSEGKISSQAFPDAELEVPRLIAP